jgi:glycosyltransferase involved in cell wall biosynthesis
MHYGGTQLTEEPALRIAYVSPCYAPHVGGVQRHVAELARRVAAQGHHVEVLTHERDRGLPAVEVIDGVTVRRFLVPYPSQHYALAPGLWAYLARYSLRYDVVHAHSYHALPALAAAVTKCRPLVFTPHYHGTGHSHFRRLLHLPYRTVGALIFRRSSRVICVSEAEAALVRGHFPYVAGRVTVIPNGVDVAALRAAEPYPEHRTIILTGGRLEEYKNVHLTVQALAHLNLSFALRVTGDGPARPALEDLVARLGLQERVEFLGRVDDTALRRWLRTATVYVSMSSHEAYGLAIAEAVAAGTRVVAADIPAHREVAATAASSIVTLASLDIATGALAQTIRSAAARARDATPVAAVPSWDAVAAQTIHIYRAVTSVTGGGRLALWPSQEDLPAPL